MKKAKFLILALAIFFASTLSGTASAAVVVAADHSGGYSNSVLDAVVKKWQPPVDGVERTIRIMVMLSGEGVVEDCTAISESGSPEADQAACNAVRSVGKFKSPPYGLPMDVFLSFWVSSTEGTQAAPTTPATPSTPVASETPVAPAAVAVAATSPKPTLAEQASAPAKTNDAATTKPTSTKKPTFEEKSNAVMDEDDYYVKMVMRKIAPNVVFPPNIPTGELSTSLSVQVDARGTIKDIKVSKSSGSEDLDNAIVKAAKKTGTVNAPPNNKSRSLFLTFIINNQ